MKKSLLLLFALIISATLFAQERALNAPDTLNARGVNKDAIELTWSRVEGATKYNIYNGNTLVTSVAGLACTINGLEPETEYCFSVSATNDTEESAKTEEECAETFYVCPTPTNLKANVVLNDPTFGKKYKITLTWDAVEGVDGYAVYASSQYVPDGIWMGNVTTNKYVNGLDIDGELHFSVIAICDEDLSIISDRSEEIGVIFSEDIVDDINAIEAPENLTATAKSNSSIILTWDEVENAHSYFVYRNDEEIANIKETSYLDENLKYDTEYCYTVTAMGVDTESDYSEEACTKTLGESLGENESYFNIFPNPASDNITISTNQEITEVNIYNILGVNVYNEQFTINNSQLNVNISDFCNGVYFIKVKTEEGEIVKRFIKK